jgi:hypothetical protein
MLLKALSRRSWGLEVSALGILGLLFLASVTMPFCLIVIAGSEARPLRPAVIKEGAAAGAHCRSGRLGGRHEVSGDS